MTLFVIAALLAADPEPMAKGAKPRELPGGMINAPPVAVDKPFRIQDERKLYAAIAHKPTRDPILKKVDFKKEEILLFSWSGSGGDRLVPVEGKEGEAAFTFVPGKSDDKAHHIKLFAVPAKATVKVTTKEP